MNLCLREAGEEILRQICCALLKTGAADRLVPSLIMNVRPVEGLFLGGDDFGENMNLVCMDAAFGIHLPTLVDASVRLHSQIFCP